VDEAHYIKNPDASRTQAVRRLLERSVKACLMSGTPMENHPREFLELIEAIRPPDAAELRRRNLGLDAAAGSVDAFHRAVAKVYLRRNQEDVLTELPDRIEVEEWVELSAAERGTYVDRVRDRNFMGMRQASTLDPATGASAKLDRLEELLEDHRESGRKVLVFSYFLGVLAAIAQRFEVVGTISGQVSPQDKQGLCDEFQARDGHAILLLQIQAGGQGLNLQKASAVVLMEPQTKPSTEAQAVARAHRMGQTQRVLVHRLMARRTCDEALRTILAEKSELFEAYARGSLVKEASGEATETSVAAAVLRIEEARLEPSPVVETAAGASSATEPSLDSGSRRDGDASGPAAFGDGSAS
jgi:SNF2 family DNA or RNA helicase